MCLLVVRAQRSSQCIHPAWSCLPPFYYHPYIPSLDFSFYLSFRCTLHIYTVYCLGLFLLLTLGAHAQEGYGSCLVCLCVCLSVCYHLIVVSTVQLRCVRHFLRLFFFLTRVFSKKPSVQKLWREKTNMQMSSYRSQPALARFEYRAYISKYLQAAH